jgi:hypothetical protein
MRYSDKHPGSALQRATGVKAEFDVNPKSLAELYANQPDLQSRHVMRRCGIGRRQASVIAGLLFGGDGR